MSSGIDAGSSNRLNPNRASSGPAFARARARKTPEFRTVSGATLPCRRPGVAPKGHARHTRGNPTGTLQVVAQGSVAGQNRPPALSTNRAGPCEPLRYVWRWITGSAAPRGTLTPRYDHRPARAKPLEKCRASRAGKPASIGPNAPFPKPLPNSPILKLSGLEPHPRIGGKARPRRTRSRSESYR